MQTCIIGRSSSAQEDASHDNKTDGTTSGTTQRRRAIAAERARATQRTAQRTTRRRRLRQTGPTGTEFQHTIEDATETTLDLEQEIEQAKQDRAKIEQAKPITDPDETATASTQEISQDGALFSLLGSALWPYKGWMIMALVLMMVVAALNVVPPYLLQQAIDGPLARGEVGPLWRIAALYGLTAIGIYVITYAYTYFLQQAGQRAVS